MLRMITAETYPMFEMSYSCETSLFREKNPVLPIEKFPSFLLARNAIWFQLSSNSGRGRLREVFATGGSTVVTKASFPS